MNKQIESQTRPCSGPTGRVGFDPVPISIKYQRKSTSVAGLVAARWCPSLTPLAVLKQWLSPLMGLMGLCVLALASGLVISQPASADVTLPDANKDCGISPCPGTTPAIWPEKSKTSIGDTAIRILGWNLLPETDYQIVVVLPDGSIMPDGFVTTDAQGDILGDDYNLTPEEAAQLTTGQPYIYEIAPAVTGVYEVRAYENLWSGKRADVPAALTTFLHN